MINHLSIPQYLLESSFCLVVFYLFYLLFLKKETYFQFNRFYLIGSALLALFIPVINVDFNSASHISGVEQIYPFISQVNNIQLGIHQTIAQESNVLNISVADVIYWVYMAGLFIMALKLFNGLFKLFGIIDRSPKLKNQDHTLLIAEEVPAASFFSYIFWKDKHDKSDPIQKTIMNHEMVHVRQWHSLDVVIMEVMVIIKWFNPLIYLFRNSLKQTHEFIADKYVTDQMGDKLRYASILLNNSGTANLPPVSNHFYGNIKERIEMLSTKKSAKLQQLKYFAILPLTIILFSLFSFDLSDRLPQPIKSSFQSIENSMLAAIDNNVVSLILDEDEEKRAFHLGWNDIMKIKLNQTNKIQDFLFYYTKSDLNQLLSSSPSISQNGKNLDIYIDTLEVITSSGKKEVSLESLKDKDFRDFFIDSLDKYDQIMLSLKTYSDTDSLFIKLHLSLDQSTWQKVVYEKTLTGKILSWGQRKIEFNNKLTGAGRRINLDESVTDDELQNMLNNKLEVSFDSKKFYTLSEDANITFNVSRASNSRLESIDVEMMEKHRIRNNLEDEVFLIGYYHGKRYTISEESKSYSLKEFYADKEPFKKWMNSCQNGDIISVRIEDGNTQYGKYEFNLRYRDDNEAISAPFPIKFPHTTESYANFQVVLNSEGKSFVRIDTKDSDSKRILDIYKGSDSYEIIHIDNFKTKNRVRSTNLPRGILEVELTDNPSISNLDILTINDYYTEDDQLVRVDWGKMVSMPNIGNYSIKEFKRSSKQKLTLFVGTKSLKMMRFDLLIIPENGKIKRLRTDNVNTESIREILSEVEENTSIYIDNIIVDVDGDNKYYPYNFVYTVE